MLVCEVDLILLEFEAGEPSDCLYLKPIRRFTCKRNIIIKAFWQLDNLILRQKAGANSRTERNRIPFHAAA